MLKVFLIILITLWVLVTALIAINIYRQFQVSGLQVKIMAKYKSLSEVDDHFTAYQDSLLKDAERMQALVEKMKKPFPVDSPLVSWVVMRTAVVILTLLTAITFWFYYRHKANS
jgi:hypothetical protein